MIEKPFAKLALCRYVWFVFLRVRERQLYWWLWWNISKCFSAFAMKIFEASRFIVFNRFFRASSGARMPHCRSFTWKGFFLYLTFWLNFNFYAFLSLLKHRSWMIFGFSVRTFRSGGLSDGGKKFPFFLRWTYLPKQKISRQFLPS